MELREEHDRQEGAIERAARTTAARGSSRANPAQREAVLGGAAYNVDGPR
jgi:hypothetical protein